jgi:hypothetical protein
MAKQIKGFVTRDDFISPSQSTVANLFELSDLGLTYSRHKQQLYYTEDPKYSLYVFNSTEDDGEAGVTSNVPVMQSDADEILNIVSSFVDYLTSHPTLTKNQAIINFTAEFNNDSPNVSLTDLDFINKISYLSVVGVDYLTFRLIPVEASPNEYISCSIWLNDPAFRNFYPDYDISIVLPFSNFSSIVNNANNFISALDNFDLLEFNARIEQDKGGNPTTYTRILNIPYRVPSSTVEKNCYFAFNIYGIQGNFDFILKLALYDYLTNDLGLDGSFVESIFPSILKINEFFVIPRWNNIALPSQVGLNAINSQVALAYSEPFDEDNFITIYSDRNYLIENTYMVPVDYNNLLLHVVNGKYSEEEVQDFREYYPDIISVTSTHPDYTRMSLRTQRFISFLEHILNIANSDNVTEMFNKMLIDTNYSFSIINRGGIQYVSGLHNVHQIYVLPKYEFYRLYNAN